MKPPPFDYHRPESLEEAVALKAGLGSQASILAGGQSLIPLLNMRLARPDALIDLNGLTQLDYVRVTDGALAVGAMTRARTVERSPEAGRRCPLVVEALRYVAHPAIRSRGTIGGSIAHADPASELPAVLAVLGATVVASGPRGRRVIAAEDLFSFHFTTTLEPDEILTEVRFPCLQRDEGCAFAEFARRHGDFALAGVAAVSSPERTRLGLLGVGPCPIVVETDDPNVAAAAAMPSEDIHASAEHRRELVRVLARDVIRAAHARRGNQ